MFAWKKARCWGLVARATRGGKTEVYRTSGKKVLKTVASECFFESLDVSLSCVAEARYTSFASWYTPKRSELVRKRNLKRNFQS